MASVLISWISYLWRVNVFLEFAK
uniref:Uncharacterized protein n=1 Tax=Arundo donax TaxID=35708 RepID=A0A0A9G536_ARUDO